MDMLGLWLGLANPERSFSGAAEKGGLMSLA
jgi:hypothetical protein